MASDEDFVRYVIDQSRLGSALSYRRLFGEFALYLDGKVVAFVCDNSVFIKITEAVPPGLPWRPPYKMAQPHPVIDELLDEPDALCVLLRATAAALPPPRPRRSRARKPASGA